MDITARRLFSGSKLTNIIVSVREDFSHGLASIPSNKKLILFFMITSSLLTSIALASFSICFGNKNLLANK